MSVRRRRLLLPVLLAAAVPMAGCSAVTGSDDEAVEARIARERAEAARTARQDERLRRLRSDLNRLRRDGSGSSSQGGATPSSAPRPTAVENDGAGSSGDWSGGGGRTVSGSGYAFDLPAGTSWTVGDEDIAGSRRFTRRITGSDGTVVYVSHTPDDRAAPDEDLVTGTTTLSSTLVDDAERKTLVNFPTDECRDEVCDDFVLNDPAFGGLAILVNGTGSSDAARAGMSIASSVTPQS